MTPIPKATITLHQKLIRLLKGMITAWEEWLKGQDDMT